MKRTEPLDRLLDKEDFDAFLMREKSDDADMYYLTQFLRSDPFIYLRQGGESTIIVSQLEYSRAKDEAEVDNVVSTREFDLEDAEDRSKELLEQVVDRFDLERVAVPEEFPLKLGDELREHIELEPVETPVMEARNTKEPEEVEKLKGAQQATEEAMRNVKSMIENADVEDGELFLEDELLTSERVKRETRKFLLEKDCSTPEGMIVACGDDSTKPHSTGSGVIRAAEPIVVDIFPQHESRYFGDMTRTFVKGEMSRELQKMKEAVEVARKAAFDVLEYGADVDASEVHDAVCDVFEEKGFDTLRQGDIESGFIHSTGHAVGLELHESPGISENEEELKAGNVLTIEPGLYIPGVGGVRIEDMILLKEDGYENFNSMIRDVEVE
jgi:Xaa-Pro aminopeptidase